MLLQTGRLQYQVNGAWVVLEEQISLDVTYVNINSRPKIGRTGIYTNESIDSIMITFKRGYNPILDAIQIEGKMPLKFLNGAINITGTFIVTDKVNEKNRETGETKTTLRFVPDQSCEFILAARGGEGGHVDDVEQDGISVVHSGVAEINTSWCAKKTDVQAEKERAEAAEARRLSLSGGTMDTYAQVSMHSGRIVDLATPTGPTHAATKKYVDDRDSIIISDLANEVVTARNKEAELQTNIDNEATTRSNKDAQLQTNITTEETRAKKAEDDLEAYCDALDATKADINHVTGTHDEVNWKTITIGDVTKYIPYFAPQVDDVRINGTSILQDKVADLSLIDDLLTETTGKFLDAHQGYVIGGLIANEAEIRRTIDDTKIDLLGNEVGSGGPYHFPYNFRDLEFNVSDKTLRCILDTITLDNTKTLQSYNLSVNLPVVLPSELSAAVDVEKTRAQTKENELSNSLYQETTARETGDHDLLTYAQTKQDKLTSANAGTYIQIDTTDPEKPVINCTNTGITLQAVYDMIYPVGSRYMGIDAPNVPAGITATWTKDNSVNGFYLQVNNNVDPGTTGAEEATCENVVLSVDQLPKHSHNMQHYHNRGDMEITGTFALAPSLSSQPHDSLPIKVSSGAFYNAGTSGGTTAAICDIDASYNRNWAASTVGFKASSSWSGLSSTTLDSGGNKITNTSIAGANEAHRHKISGIEPRKLFAGLWKRTA